MARKYVRKKPLLDESQVFAAVKEARRWIKTHKTEAGVPWKSLAEPFAAGGITARILSFRTLAAINGVKVQDRPGKEPVLGRRLDTALAEWVRAMASRSLPPTILQVKTRAARIARSMKVSFKRVLPGEEYFRGFVKRHALSLRKPTGLAEARKQAAADADGLKRWHDTTWTKVSCDDGERRDVGRLLVLTACMHARRHWTLSAWTARRSGSALSASSTLKRLGSRGRPLTTPVWWQPGARYAHGQQQGERHDDRHRIR